MSNFTMKPWPCKNPESFSKWTAKRETSERQKKFVVHRSVEGENNGECYKIKGTKTPFILSHLEKELELKLLQKDEKSDDESEKDPKRPSSSTRKRESGGADDLEDPNQPSTSTAVPKKRSRPSN